MYHLSADGALAVERFSWTPLPEISRSAELAKLRRFLRQRPLPEPTIAELRQLRDGEIDFLKLPPPPLKPRPTWSHRFLHAGLLASLFWDTLILSQWWSPLFAFRTAVVVAFAVFLAIALRKRHRLRRHRNPIAVLFRALTARQSSQPRILNVIHPRIVRPHVDDEHSRLDWRAFRSD